MAHRPAHVIHHAGGDRLHAGVHGCCVERHTAPAADAENTNAVTINLFLQTEEVHRRAKVFGVDIRRRYVARLATAFARIGRIERQGHKPIFCQGLRIQAAGLLFDRAKWPADRNRRQLAVAAVFGKIQIAYQSDPVSVLEGHLTVIDFVTFGKGFIPCAHHRNRRVWVGGFCITHCCHST